MKKIILAFLFCFIATSQCIVHAGGPLVVKGGMIISYDSRPLLYRYDNGTLGMFSNADAIALFESLYADWEAVKTSEIKFQQDNPGLLDIDVTSDNYDPILNSQDLLGYTPVIFDNDGTLLDSFLGMGAGNSVLGLSGPITVNSGPLVNQIAESQAIFNGKFVNGIDTSSDPETTVDAFKGTIIHETGHGIGLDHSQINLEAIKPGASKEIKDQVPLMFPVAVNDLFLIRRDDASAVASLYPNESELTKFGKIEGKVFRKDGKTPVLGANVIARNTNDPKLEAISSVSDYLTNNTGSYTLFAVPPGSYKIEIESIDLSFTGGSGVGPYTTSKTDKSFLDPVPKGFYTGPNLPITTDINQAAIVNVSAGQTISNANIVASTSIVSSSSSTSGSSTVINEQEPNDTVSTAQLINPPVTITGNADKSDSGDITLTSDTGSMVVISDLFKFTVLQSSSINALLTIDSDLQENDLDLVLFNSSASEIVDTSSQTGNVDELISKSISSGTYLLGVGAFSGNTSYMLAVTLTSNSGGAASLSLSGPDTLVLQPIGMNVVMLSVTGANFSSSSSCKVLTSDELITMIKPKKFSLSPTSNKKSIRIKVPLLTALNLIENQTSKTVTISVTCSNGASDEFDINITPSAESVIGNRTYQHISGEHE